MPAQIDLFTTFLDRLADAIALRLNRSAPGGGHVKVAITPAWNGKRKKGEKRAPALIARTTLALLAHIKASPGQRIEQIARAMKLPTSELKLPAQKLLVDKAVKTKGKKRGTQYFAA